MQTAAGEFLPAAPKAKAGEQRQEPSQPSVLPRARPGPKESQARGTKSSAAKALAKEEPTSTAVQGEEGKAKEVHDGAGEALPAATATKEESSLLRKTSPLGAGRVR